MRTPGSIGFTAILLAHSVFAEHPFLDRSHFSKVFRERAALPHPSPPVLPDQR